MTTALGSLAAISGYAFAFGSPATLTVNPAPVTVSALGGVSAFGTSPANPGLSATGLQNGESVNVLTGLYNTFGIDSTSKVGAYILQVGGTLSNGNYTLAGTTPGAWIVAVPAAGPSPSDPNLLVARPPAGGGDGVLDGVAGAQRKVNAAAWSAAPALPQAPGRSAMAPGGSEPAEPAGAGLAPRPSTSPVAPQGPNLPPLPATPIVAPPAAPAGAVGPANAVGPSRLAQADCGGNADTGAGADGRTAAGDGGNAVGGCATTPPRKAVAGKMDFGLSRLDRDAFARAAAEDSEEVIRAKATPRQLLMIGLAGTSVVLTAGVVGWLLRGGALLSALLSSLPLWRGFDPLIVAMRPSRGRRRGRSASGVDAIFDSADQANGSARGLPE
jgi:hypothetical protein